MMSVAWMLLAQVTAVTPPSFRWPDGYHVSQAARVAGFDPRLALAVAWVETRTNLDPRLRGHACRRRRDCEVGRFQIKPSTARRRCPGRDVRRYEDNLTCFVTMFGADVRRYGVRGAIWRHNHSHAYVRDVLAIVGELSLMAGGDVADRRVAPLTVQADLEHPRVESSRIQGAKGDP